MIFDVRGAATATTMASGGPQAKPIVVKVAGTYTVKPSKEIVKAVPLATTPKRAPAGANSVTGSGQGIFGPIRFPERALKAGDTWSGSIPVAENADLKGITMHYESTLVGFEMYQSFPCARVESNLSYKGTMPGIDAQIRKQVPAGSKLTSVGELTGTLTSYYVLDRGWAMNESAKINVILNISVTVNGRAIEFGGTIDTDQHSAVVGYPAYDAALVPKAGSASAR